MASVRFNDPRVLYVNVKRYDRLDDGEGKELSLDECPRPQLEKEASQMNKSAGNADTDLLYRQ